MRDADRDDRILAHIGLYRISFRRLIESLFFDGREAACANVIERLRHERRITAVAIRGGPLKYYQLSPPEAGRRGIPQRALPLGSRALPEAIAVLWFAKALGVDRHRLEKNELEDLFGSPVPQGPHVLERADPPRVYRVYVPGPKTKIPTVIAAVRDIASRGRDCVSLAPWIENTLYAFAILLPTEAREARFRRSLERSTLDREGFHILTARTPDTHSINEAIHALRSE